MLNLWWAGPLTDDQARNVLLSLDPNADAVDIHSALEKRRKDAAKFGVCLNEFFLRNGPQAANNARAAWSEISTHDSGANPNMNYELDMKSFDLLTFDVRAACLKQLFSYARMKHGNGRVLRMGAPATF
jgi:hypothetical protein